MSTTTSETDLGASVRALAEAAEKAPLATALGLAAGGTSALQASTDVAGMKLEDADFATISATSHDAAQWQHAFRGIVNQSMMAWVALGRQIAASGGGRETISQAMARYASDNHQAADAFQAVVRPGARQRAECATSGRARSRPSRRRSRASWSATGQRSTGTRLPAAISRRHWPG